MSLQYTIGIFRFNTMYPPRRRSLTRCLVSVLLTFFILAAVLLPDSLGLVASSRTETVTMRGKAQSLTVYDPAPDSPRRLFQVIVTSGDLGWVGLSVDIAEHLQKEGYRTIGFNARAYLSSFTGRDVSLRESDIPVDYRAILDWANTQGGGPTTFVMVGVSEGAGLAVIGMSEGSSSSFYKGIVALGVPGLTSLGFRWTDFTMWITKREPREPMADTRAYLPKIRVPFFMIHSTHDEYDSLAKAKEMYQLVPVPKRFVAIDAVNHRFSDKVPEVLAQIDKALQWFQNPAAE